MTSLVLGREDDAPLPAGTVIRALRGVRCPDGSIADILFDGDRIIAVKAADTEQAVAGSESNEGPPTPGADIDAHGWRALPAAAEPHAHLDKALSAARVGTQPNDLEAAIDQWRDLLPAIDGPDIYERARMAVQRYVSRGITSIRSHVDLPQVGDPWRAVDALLRLRDELRGRITLQVAALPSFNTTDAVLEAAIERGIDVLGGCPHLAPEPIRETTRLLDLAERHQLPVDLHTDEQVSADDVDIVDLAQQVIARRLPRPVTASHCVRLGSLPPERLAPVLELVHEAGLGIVTLPITNLYLQGRDVAHLPPRGLTAVRAVLDAGIPLAAGGDNLRDPFNPVGRADPFETTSLLITAGHLTPMEALDAVTTGARQVMGLPQVGIEAGRAADVVLVPDCDLGDVLAGQVDARIVCQAGRVLADTRVIRSMDLLTIPDPGPTVVADPTSGYGDGPAGAGRRGEPPASGDPRSEAMEFVR
jgi:cytosine deaminase